MEKYIRKLKKMKNNIDVEDNEKYLQMLKFRGYTSLPVVFKDGEFFFSGFDIKKLETLV